MIARISVASLLVALSVIALYDAPPPPLPACGPGVMALPGPFVLAADPMTPERAVEVLDLPSYAVPEAIQPDAGTLVYTSPSRSEEIRFDDHSPTVRARDIVMTSLYGAFAPARHAEGRVIYERTDAALVYAPSPRAVKEDLILYGRPQTSEFRWRLDLPAGAEARLRDDGSVGIYETRDTPIAGIAFGGGKALEQGLEERRVARLPAPTVHDATGRAAAARYTLSPGHISVQVDGLEDLSYPVTVDPTITFDGFEDFRKNSNNEGMIRYTSFGTGTPGELRRAKLAGGNLGGFSTVAGAITPRKRHCSLIYNGCLYVIGGIDGSGNYLSSIQFAPMNADGTLNAFQPATPLTFERASFGAVAYNGYLYVFGGEDSGGGSHLLIEYVKINADGSLGALWTPSPHTLSFRQKRFGYAAHRGFVYLAGGEDEFGSATGAAQAFRLKADGAIDYVSTFFGAPPLKDPVLLAHERSLYFIGGIDQAGSEQSGVAVAALDPDFGGVSFFNPTGSMLNNRSGASAAVLGGYLVVAGGGSVDFEMAPIGSGGQVGAWKRDPVPFELRRYAGYAGTHDRLYMTGGFNPGPGTLADVKSAAVTPPGGATQRFTRFPDAPFPRVNPAGAAWDGTAFLIGGHTNAIETELTAEVLASTINTGRELFGWFETDPLPEPRALSGCAIYNGYIYVVGGEKETPGLPPPFTIPSDTVYYAQINGAGVHGWSAFLLPEALRSAGCFVRNGILYVVGGDDGAIGNDSAETYRIDLLEFGGPAGGWTSQTHSSGLHTRAAVECDGAFAYIAGGATAGAATTEVLKGTFNGAGDVTWTTTTPLPTARLSPISFIANGQIYVGGGKVTVGAGGGQASMVYAPVLMGGGLGAWISTPYQDPEFGGKAIFYSGVVYDLCGSEGVGVGLTSHSDSFWINPSGTTTGWDFSSAFLPFPMAGIGGTVWNDLLYITGGDPAGAYGGTTTYSAMGILYEDTRGISYWDDPDLTDLPTPLSYHNMAAYNNRIYVFGGLGSGASPTGETLMLDVHPIYGWGFGPWSSTGAMPEALAVSGSAQYKNLIYAVGGFGTGGTSTVVQRGTIDPGTGAVAWISSTTNPAELNPLNVPRYGPGVAVYRDKLYVVGGFDAGSRSSVEAALIDPATGNLGPFIRMTSLPEITWTPGCFARDGFLYVIGGGFPSSKMVFRAALGVDGSIGQWSEITNLPFYDNSATRYLENQGHLYSIGGGWGGPTNTVLHASMLTPAHRGTWSTLHDFGQKTALTAIRFDSASPSKGTLRFTLRDEDNGYFLYFPTFTDRDAAIGANVPLTPLQTRYAHLIVELDDTQSALLTLDSFGGSIERDVETITLVHNTSPTVDVLRQLRDPSLTDIPTGGGAVTDTVNFRATITDLDGDDVRLYVEYADLDNFESFGSCPIAFEPGFSSAAAPHTLTISGLNFGHRYIWRAWAEDSPSNVWGPQVTFPETNDYSFYVDEPPSPFISNLDQFQSGGFFTIPVGGDATSTTVIFKGTVFDPNTFITVPSLRLQVEVKPIAFPLNGTALVDSLPVFDNQEATISVNGLAVGDYHWQARVIDSEDLFTGFTDFGDPPGMKDFGVPPGSNIPPNPPAALAQRNEPAGTGSLIGASTNFEAADDTVVFEGAVTDPNGGDDVNFQVEVRRVGEAFLSPGDFVGAKASEPDNFFDSGLVAQGTASITATNLGLLLFTMEGVLDQGKYRWQARAEDSSGGATLWVPFVNSSGNEPDFRIDQINDPPLVTGAQQFLSDGTTPLGFGDPAAAVVFKAQVDDPNAINPDGSPPGLVKFQVELRLSGVPFDNPDVFSFPAGGDGVNYFESAATAGMGAVVIALPSPFSMPGLYNWQYRAVDTGDMVSPGDWTEYSISDPDFEIVGNPSPNPPVNITQLTSGGLVVITEGSAVTNPAVTFRADLSDPGPFGQTIRMQVELRQIGDPFKSPATVTAFNTMKTAEPLNFFETVPNVGPFTFALPVSALSDGSYAWQVRAADADGGISGWVPFGNSDPEVPDFRVESGNDAPRPPTGLTQLTPPDNRPVAVGGIVIGHTVILKAEGRDPENGTVALDFELRPEGAAFTGVPTHAGTPVSSATPVEQTVNDLDLGGYRWRVRSRDSLGLTSAWVEFGSNSGADFTIDATIGITPNPPASLQQWIPSDGSPIPLGSTITFTSFRPKALLIHPRGDAVKLQVEVRRVIDEFTGVPTKESSFVNSGTLAATTIFGLSDGAWKWRCRAVDSKGGTTAWVEHGGNPGSASPAADDFVVDTGGAQPPLKPVIVGQFRDNGVTIIPANSAKALGTIVFRAFCIDPNGDAVRLAVEVKPHGLPFVLGQFSAISPLFPNASEISVGVGGLGDGGYKWRAFTIDSSGSISTPEEFNSSSGLPDFKASPVKNKVPEPSTALDQLKLDGSSSVPPGGLVTKFGILFRGSQEQEEDPLNPLDPTDQVRLELELRPVNTPFTGVPTAVAAYNPSGFAGEMSTVGFYNGQSFHWQMRVGNSSGKAGAWSAFGGNSDPDGIDFTATTTGVPENDDDGNCGSVGLDLLLPLGVLWAWRRGARRS